MQKAKTRFQGLALAAPSLALAFFPIMVVVSMPLRAQAPLAEIKVSLKRVDQTAHATADVSGAWEAAPPSGLYLLLREKAGTFTGTFGPRENMQSPISDLNIRDGVVRFTLTKPSNDT